MTKKIIQNFITQSDWKGLTEFITNNNIELHSLNANYNYAYDPSKYSNLNYNNIDNTKIDCLLSIAVHNEQTELVELLLRKKVNLNPIDSIQPLEMLFNGIFSNFGIVKYNYTDLSDIRLNLISIIFNHVIENDITLEINKPPFYNETASATNTNAHAWEAFVPSPNASKYSYLQIICMGNHLKQSVEEKILNIIKLFIKAKANILYVDDDKKILFDYKIEPIISNFLLDNLDVKLIKEIITKYHNRNSSDNYSSNIKTILTLDNYHKEKIEAIPASKGFFESVQIISDNNELRDPASFLAKYLSANDVRSLNRACRNIAYANDYFNKINDKPRGRG